MDMRSLIKTLLQVTPNGRPDTPQILELPFVQKRYRKYFFREDGSPMPGIAAELEGQASQSNQDLLSTIKLTKNVFKLTLPNSNYSNADHLNYQTMPVEKTVKKSEVNTK